MTIAPFTPTHHLAPAGVIVRKWITYVEEIHRDGVKDASKPQRKVVVAVVISNPYAGLWSDTLDLLSDAGEILATEMMTRALALLDGHVEAYGKAGIAGEDGEFEHVAAVLHPKFGEPTRTLAGGVSILPSVVKRGGPGVTVDIPLHHKTAMRIRSHYDAIELRIADAPRAGELVIALGAADSARPHSRVGGLRAEDAKGVDGLV